MGLNPKRIKTENLVTQSLYQKAVLLSLTMLGRFQAPYIQFIKEINYYFFRKKKKIFLHYFLDIWTFSKDPKFLFIIGQAKTKKIILGKTDDLD